MSHRFHVTRRARRDLVAIWNHIADDKSVKVADRIIAEIYDAIQLLAEHRGFGHTRADVTNPRYRFWNVYSFVIAYRVDKTPLTISRVLHGGQDFKRQFR